jgi:hypothetical protein
MSLPRFAIPLFVLTCCLGLVLTGSAQTKDQSKGHDQSKETPVDPPPTDTGGNGGANGGGEDPPPGGAPQIEPEVVEVLPTYAFRENVVIRSNRKIRHVELFSVGGKELIHLEYPPEEEVILNLTGLSAGIYVVRISTLAKEHTRKILYAR